MMLIFVKYILFDLIYNKEKQITTNFIYMAHDNVTKKYIVNYFGGMLTFNDQTGPILLLR